MKLRAVIARAELVEFAAGWLPLKVLLGEPAKGDRFLYLADPESIELVPGAGLRLVCVAQIRWPVLGVTVPITANRLVGVFSPHIEYRQGQPVLVFHLHIEEADLSGVPARFDAAVTEAVNRALSERVRPAWSFGHTLTRSIAMPSWLASTASIDLKAHAGTVEVSEEGFSFELALEASTSRRPPA